MVIFLILFFAVYLAVILGWFTIEIIKFASRKWVDKQLEQKVEKFNKSKNSL